MGDVIRRVGYYKIEVSNRPGECARILGILRDAGVNLLAFTGFPRRRKAQVDFIPEDEAAFRRVARKAGLQISSRKAGFLVQGSDRVGAVADLMNKIAEAGINVTALDAIVAGEGRYGVIFWVKPQDVAKTARLLGAK